MISALAVSAILGVISALVSAGVITSNQVVQAGNSNINQVAAQISRDVTKALKDKRLRAADLAMMLDNQKGAISQYSITSNPVLNSIVKKYEDRIKVMSYTQNEINNFENQLNSLLNNLSSLQGNQSIFNTHKQMDSKRMIVDDINRTRSAIKQKYSDLDTLANSELSVAPTPNLSDLTQNVNGGLTSKQ